MKKRSTNTSVGRCGRWRFYVRKAFSQYALLQPAQRSTLSEQRGTQVVIFSGVGGNDHRHFATFFNSVLEWLHIKPKQDTNESLHCTYIPASALGPCAWLGHDFFFLFFFQRINCLTHEQKSPLCLYTSERTEFLCVGHDFFCFSPK